MTRDELVEIMTFKWHGRTRLLKMSTDERYLAKLKMKKVLQVVCDNIEEIIYFQRREIDLPVKKGEPTYLYEVVLKTEFEIKEQGGKG